MPSPNVRRLAAIVAAAAAVAAGVVWLSWPAPGGADPDNPKQVALGATVYKENCAACHGAKLEGQPDWRVRKPDGRLPAPPHDKTGHTWHHPDDHLFRLTKFGVNPPLAPDGYKSDMPRFEGVLSDAEIWAVLAYIKSTWPANIRNRQTELTMRSRE